MYSENVGFGRPGSNVKSVTTFARHCGMLEGYLHILAPDTTTYVSPQRWMRHVVPDRPTGAGSSGPRKLYILDSCAEWLGSTAHALAEGCDLTLSNSDALGILWYALDDTEGELWY